MDQLDKDMLYIRAASEIPAEFVEKYQANLSTDKRTRFQTIVKSDTACVEP